MERSGVSLAMIQERRTHGAWATDTFSKETHRFLQEKVHFGRSEKRDFTVLVQKPAGFSRFWPPGEPPGRLLGLPGASWGVPGPPGGALAVSWGSLGTIFFRDQILIDFGVDFGTEKGAPREPFLEPKWVQNCS